MATAPYGVRLLVGAATFAVEETFKLPKTILMYPMTLASQAAHVVMRFQQNMAELVIKGDATLEQIFPPKDEQPEWATFDEDLADGPDGDIETSAPTASTANSAQKDGLRCTRRTTRPGVRRPIPRLSRSHGRGSRPGKQTVPAPAVADELDYEDADTGPVAGQAAITRRRRARGAAGLRGGHQGARAVPDAARQQDHPRDGEVTANTASNAGAPAGSANSAENPFPVRAVAIRIAAWIDKLGTVWVEGQLTQINIRPGAKTVFMVLRDPAADMSLTVTAPRDLVDSAPVKLVEGVQVVVCGKANFFTGRGTLTLRLSEIRAVGIGELLARIERLRRLLDAEGLFDPRLKRPLPFLPTTVGLITGRASAAERDVTTVAATRWPAVRFAVRNTAVQGPTAVSQIVAALRELDADPDVDVIVVARGGGSVEDLLPFSDETLCRAIAACRTPVVSAVGHEPDNPLCDLVADLRAATPTDAAKRIVPDTAAEQRLLNDLRRRSAQALRNWVAREERVLAQLRSRPVLAEPLAALAVRADEVHRARSAVRRDITRLIDVQAERVGHLSARLATLGPAATLARGYAVVQTVPAKGPAAVLRCADDAPAGTKLRVRVADGAIAAVSEGPTDGG